MQPYLPAGLHPTSLNKTGIMALCSTAAWHPWRGSENDSKMPQSNVQRFKRSSDTAVDSAVLFLSLTIPSFKRNFLEHLSRCQTSLAKPSHIANVDLINKRRRWAWLHRTPLHRLLVGAHKS